MQHMIAIARVQPKRCAIMTMAQELRMRDRQSGGRIAVGVLALVSFAFAAAPLARLDAVSRQPALMTLSIVSTSELHGEVFPRYGVGGLPLFAGYVNNLRAAR